MSGWWVDVWHRGGWVRRVWRTVGPAALAAVVVLAGLVLPF